MKKYLLILGIISIFLISACSQQPETIQPAPQPNAPQPEVVVESANEPSHSPIKTSNPLPFE